KKSKSGSPYAVSISVAPSRNRCTTGGSKREGSQLNIALGPKPRVIGRVRLPFCSKSQTIGIVTRNAQTAKLNWTSCATVKANYVGFKRNSRAFSPAPSLLPHVCPGQSCQPLPDRESRIESLRNEFSALTNSSFQGTRPTDLRRATIVLP